MNRIEFDNLEIIDQINYINQSIGTLTDICQTIPIGRATISERFKRQGYIYNKDIGQYYLSNTSVIEIHSNRVKVPTKPRESHITPYQNELIELAENKDALMEMLREYKRDKEVIIEIPQLDLNKLPLEYKSNIVNKSIKIYEKVYELFNDVCDSYSSHKKQDMISLALWEFIERYKK